MTPIAWIGAAASALLGLVAGYVTARRVARRRVAEARSLCENLIANAQREAEAIRQEAQASARALLAEARMEGEREARQRRERLAREADELRAGREELARRLEVLERTEAALGERSAALEAKQKQLDERMREVSRLLAEQNTRLERIARMSPEEAKRQLMRNLEDEARHEGARRARAIRERAERDAEREARRIIATAIQRYAADQCVETTVSVVDLPGDEMKGRIIGRDGRNIRAFEAQTGVDVVIDDTPGAVIVSSFDPVRREVARLALQRLVEDGRIHPGRIEEVVARTREEVEASVVEAGEQACLDLGVQGMARELVELVGRMRYRTSFGQNCLRHSMEVAWVAGMMAAELNLDPVLARRAGLLHDIGKVVSHETEGAHTEVGAEIARRYGEPPEVVNAIRAHHGDVEATSLYTPLVGAADALSGARPGARREALEAYVKRLSRLEAIADAFEGVVKSYAIQAGREVRIIVDHRIVSDERAAELAYEISRRVEQEMDFPGQIKVVVVRETRAVEYAR